MYHVIWGMNQIPIDISSWSLTDLDGVYPQFAASPVNLGPDEYAIVHFSDGINETGSTLSSADANGNGYWDL